MVTYIGPDPLRPLCPLLAPPPRKLSQRSASSSALCDEDARNGANSSDAPAFSWSHHLDIITALKGRPVDLGTRICVVESIYRLNEKRTAELVDFLVSPQGAIAATLENNACKRFHCTKDALDGALGAANAASILCQPLFEMWEIFTRQIVPTLCAMLYPLEQSGKFHTSQTMFAYFRDRVLLKLFAFFASDEERGQTRLYHDLRVLARIISIFQRVHFEANSRCENSELSLFGEIFSKLLLNSENILNCDETREEKMKEEEGFYEENLLPSPPSLASSTVAKARKTGVFAGPSPFANVNEFSKKITLA